MPLDALGRTRATMPGTAGVFPSPRGAGNPLKALLFPLCGVVLTGGVRRRAWAWSLQVFSTNEECLVAVGH